MNDKDSLADNGEGEPATLREDFVSVKEAAKLLRISEATAWRWINQLLLPAYRLGQKRVYVKRADLQPLIIPARETESPMSRAGRPRLEALTASERGRLLTAVEESRRRLARMLDQRGGRLYPSSSAALEAMRQERSRQLQ
jgi:excisionase family DNA binding protein